MIPSQTIIKTDIIRGSADRYIRQLAVEWLGKWWWVLLLPIAVPVILGLTVNQAWLYVAVMLLFLCYPTVMLLMFCQYALRPQARKAVHDYTVTFTPSGFTIMYMPLNEDKPTPPTAETVNFDEITDYSINSKGITVKWGNTPYDFLFLPHDSLESKEQAKKLIEWLRDR